MFPSTNTGFSLEELTVLNKQRQRNVHFCYFALLRKMTGVSVSHLWCGRIEGKTLRWPRALIFKQ